LNPGQALVKVWPGFLVSGLDTVDATIADQPEDAQGLSLNEQHLQFALASAERKLAEARLQIAELEALLDEIPEIFERKFKQRLQPVLERQERLLDDNAELRHQIQLLAPVPGEVRLRFNPEAGRASNGLSLPQLPSRPSLQRMGRADRQGPRAA
jgi:septal ring factor EnvC (AmiA/AmiB activator)